MQANNKFAISRRKFIAALAGLPVLTLPWTSASAAVSKPFSFIYISDCHLVTGQADTAFKMLQESQLFLQEIIKGVNALNPDFVIFGGDQVETVGNNDANWQLFIDLAQALTAPWSFVLGEQDVSGKIPVDKMKEFGPDFKGRGITGSTPYWSLDPIDNVHLIGLDTSVANSATGEISEEQLEWLKKDLAANKGKFTIVASHHPLLPPAPYDGGPPWDEYIVPNGADAREIIGTSSDVRLVLSGHLYMNKAQLERDVYHISCAGLNVYPCQYKYFKVSKEAIIMESFEVPFPALVKKARKALADSSLASKLNRKDPEAVIQLFEGHAEDQNAFMSLAASKSIKELSKKQLKEDTERRDTELEKKAEEARSKGKKKGKQKQESKKVDSKKEESSSKEKSSKKSSRKQKSTDAKESVPANKKEIEEKGAESTPVETEKSPTVDDTSQMESKEQAKDQSQRESKDQSQRESKDQAKDQSQKESNDQAKGQSQKESNDQAKDQSTESSTKEK